MPIYCPLQGSDLQTPPTFDLPSFPDFSAHTSPDRGKPQETCVGPVTDKNQQCSSPRGTQSEINATGYPPSAKWSLSVFQEGLSFKVIMRPLWLGHFSESGSYTVMLLGHESLCQAMFQNLWLLASPKLF